MDGGLTKDDISFLIESLRYTKQAFQDYGGYPSYEFKQERLREVDTVVAKLRALRGQLCQK